MLKMNKIIVKGSNEKIKPQFNLQLNTKMINTQGQYGIVKTVTNKTNVHKMKLNESL